MILNGPGISYTEPDIGSEFVPPLPEHPREAIVKLCEHCTNRLLHRDELLGYEYWSFAEAATDEQAEVLCKMKMRRPYTLPEMAKLTGMPETQIEKMLDDMSYTGLLEYNWENPERAKQWVLPMLVPGSAEFLNMRVSQLEEHPVYAKFFEQASKGPLSRATPMVPPGGAGIGMHVIPVEKAIDAASTSVPIEHIEHWLDKYDGKYAASTCSCRASRRVMGEGCADDPADWCIAVGDMADYVVETDRGHYVTRDEVYDILRQAEDNGFVHQITNIDGENKIFAICNCNVNVCYALRTSQLFNTPNLSRSAYVAKVEKDKCVACGRCVEVCPAGAAKLGQKLCSKKAGGQVPEYPRQELPDATKWDHTKWSPNYRNDNRIETHKSGTAPCKTACPAHVAVQGYLKLAAQGRYDEALALIKRENPLPAICGRVCNRRCEDACTRGRVDAAVAIDEVKKFIAQRDLDAATRYVPPVVTPTRAGGFDQKIAIIGAGPAGLSCAFYLAEKGYKPVVFEKNERPGGMLTYGIPSFKLQKDVIEAEVEIIRLMGAEFRYGVEVGRDVTLDELLERYDAVLFATGAVEDKPLGLPGSDLDGVYGAAKFVEWYDGYPTGAREWPLDAEEVAVIGGGNVAMDVARELMRNADDLKAKTDIPDNVYEGIKANKAKTLHLFIRRGVAQAKFSVQELREMEKLPGVQLIINEDDFDLDDDTIEEAGKDKLTRQMVEELFTIREMAEDMEDDGDTDFEGNPADRKYYIHFNFAPVEVLGEDGKVKAIRVEKTTTSADGKMTRTGEFEEYPVQAVYHAIGYKPATAPGIAYDERRAHLANANGDGRITTEASGEGAQVRERLYATGWAKRGPVGLIGSTKSDALLIVTNMLEDLSKAAEGGRVAADRDPESIDRLLASRGVKPIDFAGWKKVDAFERAEGAKEGREHKKVIDPEQMRALAHA